MFNEKTKLINNEITNLSIDNFFEKQMVFRVIRLIRVLKFKLFRSIR